MNEEFPIKQIGLYFITLIFLFFSYQMLLLSLPYISFDPTVDFLRTKQDVIRHKHWEVSFYIHVFTSIFVLVSGFPQFFPSLLAKYRKLHIVLGRIYVFTILCLSAPSGLIMAFYANGGILAQIGFVILSFLWFGTTMIALLKIYNRQVEAHKKWMIRSFALTCSAITLRSWIFILSYIGGIDAVQSYIYVAWLSWIPNLIVAEIIIYLQKKH